MTRSQLHTVERGATQRPECSEVLAPGAGFRGWFQHHTGALDRPGLGWSGFARSSESSPPVIAGRVSGRKPRLRESRWSAEGRWQRGVGPVGPLSEFRPSPSSRPAAALATQVSPAPSLARTGLLLPTRGWAASHLWCRPAEWRCAAGWQGRDGTGAGPSASQKGPGHQQP